MQIQPLYLALYRSTATYLYSHIAILDKTTVKPDS